ncbi:hypothetical protein TPENAI_60919 [Tenacibaculum litopenaei]|uniref:response regulator transcription factor n=1 Tax=Tenacibaculum litopenaei TaxID=396016 RepID=UPI003892F121
MKEIKVVIAEDHDLLSESYRMFLEGDGLRVVGVVKNGIELLKWLPKSDVDVIVLDIKMPIMSARSSFINVAKQLEIPFLCLQEFEGTQHAQQRIFIWTYSRRKK